MSDQLSAVVFDLDDTLYRYRNYKWSGFRAVAQHVASSRQVGAEEIQARLERITDEHGLLYDDAFDDLAAVYEWQEEYVNELITVYRNHEPEITMAPDAIRLLESLTDRTVSLGVLTEGVERMQQRKINALGLTQYIDAYEITDDKRKTRPFLSLLGKLDVPPRNSCYVGDDPTKDFLVPQELGMTTVRLQAGIRKHETGDSQDYEINTMTELPEVIKLA